MPAAQAGCGGGAGACCNTSRPARDCPRHRLHRRNARADARPSSATGEPGRATGDTPVRTPEGHPDKSADDNNGSARLATESTAPSPWKIDSYENAPPCEWADAQRPEPVPSLDREHLLAPDGVISPPRCSEAEIACPALRRNDCAWLASDCTGPMQMVRGPGRPSEAAADRQPPVARFAGGHARDAACVGIIMLVEYVVDAEPRLPVAEAVA